MSIIPEIEIPCTTAQEFINELDETNKRWENTTWIYRGQLDVTWSLLPKAMRSPILESYVQDKIEFYNNRELLDVESQEFWNNYNDDIFLRFVQVVLRTIGEKAIVQSFVELADKVGLIIPDDHFAVLGGNILSHHEQIMRQLNSRSTSIIHTPAIVIYALAQHHGIPTRLLDWTYLPLVAGFFSAFSAEEPASIPNKIVVWAVKRSELSNTHLKLVTHRRSKIGFLQSQDGVFIYDTKVNDYFVETGTWKSFEIEFEKVKDSQGIYQITLPYSERGNLLDLLERKNISRPFLMPSFDNVAQEIIQERIDWLNILED
jgi:hypothetical protein